MYLASAPIAIRVERFGPIPCAPHENTCILLFSDKISLRDNLHVISVVEFTAEGTAKILVNCSIPTCGCPVSLLLDIDYQECAWSLITVCGRLGVRNFTPNVYHPNGNRAIERGNHYLIQRVATVVHERQDDWE